MDAMLIPITRSPKLPQLFDELKQLLAAEAVARQKFRDWVTPGIKAEFINGEIVVHSPAKLRHNNARSLIERLLGIYVDRRGLGEVSGEKAMLELKRNDYEPDVCFWDKTTAATFQPDQMLFPPADLVVEVLSPSTELLDRGTKYDDYAANGVREYWIVDPVTREVDHFELHGGNFRLKAKLSERDTLRSDVVVGFEAAIAAFFDAAENLKAVAAVLA